MTMGDEVTISAVVTDPDGIEDLIGGVLLTKSGAQLGAFQSAADEGAYSFLLTWKRLHEAEAIEFADSAVEGVIADFYDAAGHHTSAEVSLNLYCDAGDRVGYVSGGVCVPKCTGTAEAEPCSYDNACCSGSCVDTSSDADHCGACNNKCSITGGSATCGGGYCQYDCPTTAPYAGSFNVMHGIACLDADAGSPACLAPAAAGPNFCSPNLCETFCGTGATCDYEVLGNTDPGECGNGVTGPAGCVEPTLGLDSPCPSTPFSAYCVDFQDLYAITCQVN
jgi:hypothetical protein